jgi:hypothetical protein
MMGFEDREKGKSFFSLQKGFVPRISGCGQHTYMANMAINRALSKRRELYIIAIDMKDAFGSVSHRLLEHNLKDMNFPQTIRELVMDSYFQANVNINSKKGMTNPIAIKRGVKQGCPLSTLLFNSCLDSLIIKLNTQEMKKCGFGINSNIDDNLVCQAYADDILLFAEGYNNIMKLVDTLNSYLVLHKYVLTQVNARSLNQN